MNSAVVGRAASESARGLIAVVDNAPSRHRRAGLRAGLTHGVLAGNVVVPSRVWPVCRAMEGGWAPWVVVLVAAQPLGHVAFGGLPF